MYIDSFIVLARPWSSLPMHSTQTGHSTTPENFNIIGREDHGLARTIKESIYIRVNNSTLNRNISITFIIYVPQSYLTPQSQN